MGKKKNKKAKQPKKKRQPPEVKRTRHGFIQRRTLNVPEIQNLVTDNERGGRSQNTDNMTEDKLLQHISGILEGYSPIGYNSPEPNFAPGSEAIKLARQRRGNNPKPKPKSKKMGTPSGASFDRRLSFGGRRKSKRRRKKKRRRTIKKKRKKRKKKN
tara:strand:- start:91 stop:561 length:471 start_codon:yes stop_codon:yes gene_type:complete